MSQHQCALLAWTFAVVLVLRFAYRVAFTYLQLRRWRGRVDR